MSALPVSTSPTLPDDPSSPGAPAIGDDRPPLRLAGRRPLHGHLSCDSARSLADLAHLRPEWDRLVESLGGAIDLSYDWCRMWWEQYGPDGPDGSHHHHREARVFVFREENELVGVVPMVIDRPRIGPTVLRLARILGADPTRTVGALPIRPGWTEPIVDEVLQRLIIDDRCEAIHLGPLPAAPVFGASATSLRGAEAGPLEPAPRDHDDRYPAMRDTIYRRRDLVSVLHEAHGIDRAVIDRLPETPEAYLASLPESHRDALRRDRRRLEHLYTLRTETVTDPDEVLTELGLLARMHAEQWRHRGGAGLLGERPDLERFHVALVRRLAPTGRVLLFRLRADDLVVARHYALRFGDTAYCQLSARLGGAAWSRFSLGRLSLAMLVEHLIRERGADDTGATSIRRIDLGIDPLGRGAGETIEPALRPLTAAEVAVREAWSDDPAWVDGAGSGNGAGWTAGAACSDHAAWTDGAVSRDYRARIGADLQPLRSIFLAANREGPRNRARLFAALSRQLDRWYYRGWYRGVAPRLPIENRPLWRSWYTSQV